ncbi:hypothetical protein B0T14DRAFT_475183 [Immersiella caudata]|uniref:Uncharacterized protein n=1 Tax=Immersiella caudata TaxID=314043 RepID=A0AA40C7L8_9PEZI|nr:hypothetical protein B0T14DRAFT_475183 [Immersiella caudata]
MNNSSPANSSTVSWANSPEGRGTIDLVVSCIVTFTLCVWSALHLNVPPMQSTPLQLAIEKTIWVLYGIFAPELVVATAASQYIVALWLKGEIKKDADFRMSQNDGKDATSHTWSVTQCYYAAMGGCVANVPWMGDDGEEEMRRVTLTPAGIRLLSFVGRLPNVDEAQVRDKSKADWMAKSIVCVQATWMVAQVVGRLIERLPVSLLEINTCGHVVCAFALYLLWWSKPLDIQDPSILENGDDDVLAERVPDENNGFRYEYAIAPELAEECHAYLMPPYDDLKVRHGDLYCRRARLESRDMTSYRRLYVKTLQRASRAVDMIWTEKCQRQTAEYERLYFTVVPRLAETGYYLSETEYLLRNMPNLPSLTNLSLGQVDCHQNVLPAIFAFTALAYGGLHLSAWNDFYPSQAERYTWIIAALWIACSGGLVWISCSLGLLTKKLGSVRALQKNGDLVENPWRRWLPMVARWCIYVVGVTFAVTRVFLVVEAFASLREAPREMYRTPEWSNFLPHL